jgi:hypothetical protein
MKIGELRRSLFVNHDCKWNSLVREVTALRESHDEKVREVNVYRELLEKIKENATLDRELPWENGSRLQELFVESA